VAVGVDGVLPEVGGGGEAQGREERSKKHSRDWRLEIGNWRAQVAHDQVDGGDRPGPDGSGQQVSPERHRAHRDERLPEFDQQRVKSIARRVGDTENRRDELILGWVAKERSRSSSSGI